MTWVEFQTLNKNNILETPCGSGCYIILDGRNNLENLIKDSEKLLKTRINWPLYQGYSIMKGDRLSNGYILYQKEL